MGRECDTVELIRWPALPMSVELEAAAELRTRSTCMRGWEGTVRRRLGEAARQASSDLPSNYRMSCLDILQIALFSVITQGPERNSVSVRSMDVDRKKSSHVWDNKECVCVEIVFCFI